MKLSKFSQKLKFGSRDQLLNRVSELEKQGKSIVHFEIGEPDFSTQPSIIEAAIDSLRKGETHYDDADGLEEFRSAISKKTKEDLGFAPDLDQIIIGPSPALIYFLLQCVADPGDEVIVQEPAYARFYSLLDLLGIKPVVLPLEEENNFRIDAKELQKRITGKTRLIIVNSPHNPTGTVMSKKEVSGIAKVAEKNNIFLLSDEVYGKLVYDGSHYSPGVQDQCRQRTIILNSFSKAYAMTGWRIGYFIAPKELVAKMKILLRNTVFSTPVFIQRAGISALTGDQKPLQRMVKEYKKRRDFLVTGLNKLPGISCVVPRGAFYAFPNIRGTGFTDKEFVKFMLEKAGVLFSPGTDFGANCQDYVRASFSIPMAEIKEGLRRMAEALKKK